MPAILKFYSEARKAAVAAAAVVAALAASGAFSGTWENDLKWAAGVLATYVGTYAVSNKPSPLA